jgi:hypothetical protein
MATPEPNPQSAKEPAEGSRDHVAPDARRAADRAQGSDNESQKNTDQTLTHPGIGRPEEDGDGGV